MERKIFCPKQNKKKTNESKFLTVSKDGTGDFVSIQEAINQAPSFPYERITIFVKNGIYNEKIRIYSWNPKINLVGENKDSTLIVFDHSFDKINLGRNSTFHTSTLAVEANDCKISNLTIKNSAGEVGQAIALALLGNRILVENCKISGNQDSFYAQGENFVQYVKDCYIEGTTDFIFGNATVLFENCEIKSLKNSYITAASTEAKSNYGFVFMNCHFFANETVTQVYLGRPWRIYAKTVLINCQLEKHILPEGWHDWDKIEAQKTTFYAEYRSFGKGANPSKRVRWAYQLRKKELKKYTPQKILGENTFKLLAE